MTRLFAGERLAVEHQHQPLRIIEALLLHPAQLPGAGAEWRARMFPPEDQRPAPRLPDFKPLGKGVGGRDLDDRVWVGLSTTAQRVPPRMVAQINSDSITVSYWEPREYAVFRSTGEYLGIVSFPIEVITWALPIGDTVWVALAAEDGAHVLVRYGLPGHFRNGTRRTNPR